MLKKLAFAVALSIGMLGSLHAEEPKKIAFVDTGNTGRSVSAEALSNVLISKMGAHIAVISRAVDMDPFDIHPKPMLSSSSRTGGLISADIWLHKSRPMMCAMPMFC